MPNVPADLSLLADFDLVARHGGFGRAQRAAGRPKASLSRRIAELERQLAVRLILRGGARMRLTEEGAVLAARIAGPLTELSEAAAAASAQATEVQGRLRVSAPVVFAQVVLGRVAARLALAHPELRLEVVAEDRRADPVQDGFDVVIRVDPAADEQLVGRRILVDARVIAAAPTLSPPWLGGPDIVPAVMFGSVETRVWQLRDRHGTEREVAIRPGARLSSMPMVREAVLEGGGAAVLPRLLVADDLDAGRLVEWGRVGAPVEVWMLHHARRLPGAKLRAFLDAVAAVTAAQVAI
jgi:DNA-binding transcriptional LysR family regulator